jgi:hypothetical protein
MVASRVGCALALFSFGACSFPEYRVDDDVAASCRDGIRDGDEAGIDCGPSCSPCPLCSDGMLNGSETGVDCGGTCTACPTCDDKLQNGGESDVDCGGTCEKRCDVDRRCREGADCASLVCAMDRCQPSDCHDGVRNGLETGKDCGGGCVGCDFGSACNENADCSSTRCQNSVCVNAGCTDSQINGHETDVDCGGGECSPCAVAGKCKDPADCLSHVCSASSGCTAATCSDTTQNQDESSPDCGGPNCPPCDVGKTCFIPSDCESALCHNGTCVPKNPSGQPLSRAKWQLSSSEESTQAGVDQPFDGSVSTVWTSGTPQHTGMYVDVDLGSTQIFFKALVQTTEAPYDQDFPNMLEVYVSNDGDFGDPSATNIMGNPWTWVDFDSAQVGRYVRFALTKPWQHAWSIGEINLYN